LGSRYPTAGCEHFGISSLRSPTQTSYYWLVADPTNPGQLMRYSGPPNAVSLPIQAPVYHPIVAVIPPAVAGQPPVVVFQIQVPPPPPPPPALPPQFGDAKWVKVFEGELDHEVDVNDLMAGNIIVPMDAAKLETPWNLLQYSPRDARKGQMRQQRGLGNGSHAVVRRYEFYKFTGHYDPLTHEALCADGLCNAPAADEVGDMIAAQMAAANVEIPSVTITKIGSGTVSSASPRINCGANCTGNVAAGTQVTLTAQPPSSGIFSGWTGDCTGIDPTCTVTVNKPLNMTATFATVYTLSIGRGNGVVTGTPDGAFGTTINCGGSCSAKYPQGTTVTLSAAPNAGHSFINWTGACAGTSLSCTVSINSDTKVQANFK
jgi:hypothetical protein